jgi:hypothetical protein
MSPFSHMLTRIVLSATIASLLGSGLPERLVGQVPQDSVAVVVTVSTASGTPIPAVDLAISKAPIGAILAKRTNEAGSATFLIERSNVRHSILARKFGWAPTERPIEPANADSIRVTLQLEPAAADLKGVVVEAKAPHYVLLESEIAASRRPVRDALEALQKLKPSMLYDRDRCPGEVVDNVWINGRRVLFMASNTPILGGRSSRTIGNVRIRTQGGRAGGEPPAVDSVLASIRAEHVQDIRLVNCWDTSLPGVGSNNALYVALKPGVDWDWRRGSFVPDSLSRIRR